jgi:hypothetical protein
LKNTLIFKYINPLLLVIIFVISLSRSYAQKNELGGGIGALNYIGELSSYYNPVNLRPAVYGFYRRNFSPVVAARFALCVGGLHGADNGSNAVSSARNASFGGLITDMAFTIEYNFFDYILNYIDRKQARKYSPYLTAGIAIYNFNGKSSLSASPNRSTALAIPLGIGIKYMLTDKWNIGAELVARKIFTDNLDGVDGYTLNNKLLADPVDKDYYYMLGFNISYTFYKVHCPGK